MDKPKKNNISCDGCVIRSILVHEHSKHKKCCKNYKKGKRCKRCPKA